jgi:hypothetical protein
MVINATRRSHGQARSVAVSIIEIIRHPAEFRSESNAVLRSESNADDESFPVGKVLKNRSQRKLKQLFNSKNICVIVYTTNKIGAGSSQGRGIALVKTLF